MRVNGKQEIPPDSEPNEKSENHRRRLIQRDLERAFYSGPIKPSFSAGIFLESPVIIGDLFVLKITWASLGLKKIPGWRFFANSILYRLVSFLAF